MLSNPSSHQEPGSCSHRDEGDEIIKGTVASWKETAVSPPHGCSRDRETCCPTPSVPRPVSVIPRRVRRHPDTPQDFTATSNSPRHLDAADTLKVFRSIP
ncbi:hypothetical protein SKAU_G00074730 [Synaphobranchus kaupii]|uniref:Uncharacterized protein n=1 Tax=Synaphobranchus kaupii TaxID=118154 RepID=A0A9Q1JBM9_SYNKA|nr:hypothetical protein SKAU_G00074730 [Synaphobranchus kaupii]